MMFAASPWKASYTRTPVRSAAQNIQRRKMSISKVPKRIRTLRRLERIMRIRIFIEIYQNKTVFECAENFERSVSKNFETI